MREVPACLATPHGFMLNNCTKINHICYSKKIRIPHCPDVVYPHYIKFNFNFECHEHYAFGLRDETGHADTHGWPLHAATFKGPSPKAPINGDLYPFHHNYPTPLTVDIALFALDDPGIMADIDHYHTLSIEGDTLTQQATDLARDQDKWHCKMVPVKHHLVASHIHSHLYPYLTDQALIPNTYLMDEAHTGGTTLTDTLAVHKQTPLNWLPMPWLHDKEHPGVGSQSHVGIHAMTRSHRSPHQHSILHRPHL